MKSLSFPLSAEAEAAFAHGAVVVFEGRIRSLEEGRPIAAIRYEAYVPMAEKIIAALIRRTESDFSCKAGASHRLGRVPVGEAAVTVTCSAAHREEAFAGARFLIDAIKAEAPIWKADYEWL